jgi:Tfp pilus assembly protein PilN
MQQRINLVPQRPLAERIKALIPIIFSLMLLLIGIVFFTWVQFLNSRLAELNSTIVRIEEQSSQAMALSSQIASWKKDIESKNLAIDQKTGQIATLSRIQGQKKKFSKPLSLIASLLPDTVRCREISFTGNDGKLQGTALDYDDLIRLVRGLQGLTIFKTVSLSVTDRATTNDQERIQFTLILQLA